MPDSPEDFQRPAHRVLWDRQNCLPLDKILGDDGDVLLLLTPVVIPLDAEIAGSGDPFEPLGKTLSKRHPCVRHVPYTKRLGITGVHAAFIKRVKAVIFVVTSFEDADGASQRKSAEIVEELCKERPLIVVTCCEIPVDELGTFDFPTVVQAPSFSAEDLKAISLLLLGRDLGTSTPTQPAVHPFGPKHSWKTEDWDHSRDDANARDLWLQSMSKQYHLDRDTWSRILDRRGHAAHRVVLHPHTKIMVGFCLTYTSHAYESSDHLVRSIAAIVVREEFRNQGIGNMLHEEAIHRVTTAQRISRIQLGSTFPRLLYGVPADSPETMWFQKRGWTMNESTRGKGLIASDWVLRFSDMPISNLASAGLKFRPCGVINIEQVRKLVSDESERRLGFGWYDQYARVLDSSHMDSILIGFEGTTLVAAAITYIPGSQHPIAAELSLARNVGSDIGDDPEMVSRPDTVMVRLLHGCSKVLQERGMAGMFIDAVKYGEAGFESLGQCRQNCADGIC
ncbi:hypothetical protein S40285_04231 [Stachybotrys chlorohalonatus IBT 40285]|uniref:N-acetyltransferase domain-containing protein n=1 Tax=Stachybotrys chlorohalonatus (strain IBT 40285) TaxID=1283841 RepID=A0A084QUC3_STAC4|nr:hypothetical protein S40285_04231 [Stachybotrys chlorohalonata IBT 40285]